MKLIINIPDRIHFGIENGFCVNGSDASQIVLEAVKDGTPISDNATNGDIMNLMFDIVEDKHPDKGTINLYFFDLDIAIVVSLAWWNAPYQRGDKE